MPSRENYFRIINSAEFIQELEMIKTRLPNAEKKFLRKVAGKVVASAKLATPVDTGFLRNSWDMEDEEHAVAVFNNVEYALPIETGRANGNRGYTTGFYMLKKAFMKIDDFAKESLRGMIREITR